jgi:hypothetical protein
MALLRWVLVLVIVAVTLVVFFLVRPIDELDAELTLELKGILLEGLGEGIVRSLLCPEE